MCCWSIALLFTFGTMGGRHSTVVALALCTQPSQVRMWLLEKLNQEDKKRFFREPAFLKLFDVSALERKQQKQLAQWTLNANICTLSVRNYQLDSFFSLLTVMNLLSQTPGLRCFPKSWDALLFLKLMLLIRAWYHIYYKTNTILASRFCCFFLLNSIYPNLRWKFI